MTAGSFDILSKKLSEMIKSEDPSGILEYMAFPFTLVEDDFTLVLRTPDDLREIYNIFHPTMGGVEYYNITDANVQPFGGMLYIATYRVSVAFGNGHTRDPAKRAIVLGDRDGKTKAISAIAFLEFSTQWLAENDPDKLEEVKKWAS